jgi:quinoprotein glucose dehydrogenase
MAVHETDILIIGGGITSAMLAQKLNQLRPSAKITVVEAGRSIFDVQNRGRYRERAALYGEHPWPEDYIEDQHAAGIISMTMAVGGLALHWGGACNRFSEEDLRLKSLYGLATDWPLAFDELERYYCEAEKRLNVSGEPSPHPEDKRTQPYPQAPIPLSYNLQILKSWAEKSGLRFSPLPMARNLSPFDGRGSCCVYDTCGEVCPSGARYSPDYTFRQLAEPKKIVLHDRTLVRKLVLDDRRSTIVAAQGWHQDRPTDSIDYRANTFVIASGYCWSSHLLLLSANSRFPNGLANSSGLVGRYMNGHSFIQATANIDDQTFPGQNMTHSLISREYFRCRPDRPFVRHDTRVWESSAGTRPAITVS